MTLSPSALQGTRSFDPPPDDQVKYNERFPKALLFHNDYSALSYCCNL